MYGYMEIQLSQTVDADPSILASPLMEVMYVKDQTVALDSCCIRWFRKLHMIGTLRQVLLI